MAETKRSLPWRRLNATVVALGFTSFFTDFGSEMIFPLLPLFLTSVLGAGPAFLGLVEGAADAVASLLKLVAGHLSDRTGRRKPLVAAGYGLAGAVRPLMAIAQAPWQALAIRVTDRVGKGVRGAPRDAMIADSTPAGAAGRAFGFQRGMDHLGAVIGPLVASFLLARGVSLRHVFAWAALPGVVSLAIVLLIRERRPRAERSARVGAPDAPGAEAPLGWRGFSRAFWAYLAILFLFSLGNSSDAFLLLRARDLGVAAAAVPLLWSALHVSKVACSWVGGTLADRVPRVALVAAGWVVYAATYLWLAAARSPIAVWGAFGVYGLFYGLTEPSERALVRELVPAEARGRAYGAYNFAIGIAALPAGLLMGWLWTRFGAPLALGAGAAIAGISAILLAAWSVRGLRATR